MKTANIQLATLVIAILGFLGGSIAAYINVTSTLATAVVQIQDFKTDVSRQFTDVKTDLQRVDRSVASINDYLRPTRRTDLDLERLMYPNKVETTEAWLLSLDRTRPN